MKCRDISHDASRSISSFDWCKIEETLNDQAYALLPSVLSPEECRELIGGYEKELYRNRVVMARHSFGKGEYKYFSSPLPDFIAGLRSVLYEHLVPIANAWNVLLKKDIVYPAVHADFIQTCHAANQIRPTPLLLRYEAGDYNRLHQDLYGEIVFPLQAVFLLSDPNKDFVGGEFVLTEQRARVQSRVEVVPFSLGDAIIFPVSQRPVMGTRGPFRVNMRHGVSRLRSGHRWTLGIPFHDAP